MPFPLIPVIIVATSVLVGGTIIGTIVYTIGSSKVEVKKANYKDKADVTILFTGESEAGKDTVIELIITRKFVKNIKKTAKYNTLVNTVTNFTPPPTHTPHLCDIDYKDKIKIKIINTSGSENTWKDTEEAKKLHHDIRCYIFDARKFYNEENIKFGIQDTIDECKEKGIKYISLGTRGDEVDKVKIENEVRSMGMECSIFELSKEPVEEVIKFLFKGYL